MPRITRKTLPHVAEVDGCKVERHDGHTWITRDRNRQIIIWQDGCITRGHIDLTCAKEMSVGEAANVLQLL